MGLSLSTAPTISGSKGTRGSKFKLIVKKDLYWSARASLSRTDDESNLGIVGAKRIFPCGTDLLRIGFLDPMTNVRIVKSERLGLKLLSGAHKERSFILYAVEESTEEPPTDKQKRKLKRKAKINSDMMRYSEEVLKPWKMADSFNSTTMRFLFEVKVRTKAINSTHSASSYLATHIAFTYAI